MTCFHTRKRPGSHCGEFTKGISSVPNHLKKAMEILGVMKKGIMNKMESITMSLYGGASIRGEANEVRPVQVGREMLKWGQDKGL